MPDFEAILTSVRTAVEAVGAENRELRALLAAFAEPARAVLEAVDRFADDKGEKAVEPAPVIEPRQGKRPPTVLGTLTTRPSEDVIAGWARELETGVSAAEIGARYNTGAVRIGMFVHRWRQRQAAVEAPSTSQTITIIDAPSAEVEAPPFLSWSPSARAAGHAASS